MNLNELSSQELFEQLNKGELSVLRLIGAGELHDEMEQVGELCTNLANWICSEEDDSKLRKRACRMIKTILPAKLEAEFPDYDDTIVIGFNHPSLGEIFRLLYLGFEKYPEREFLFPVNIPWYENIVPIIPQLKRMKISVTPLITPATEEKLMKMFSGDEEKLSQVRHLKTLFERKYMREARRFAENRGIIVVAPSATRQAEVISDNIHPTMTLLAHMIFRNSNIKALFLPVAIIEPKNNDRKVNLLKLYGIYPCKPFYADEVKRLTEKGRTFDITFLKRIDEIYCVKKKTNFPDTINTFIKTFKNRMNNR